MSLAHQPFPTLRGLPNIILTSLFSSVWLAFLPNLGVFCLHGRVLLVIGLMSACGLVTTLGITVRCNIVIRPESVRCALVIYDVKYVHLLATTLGIAVYCNTTIRPEFVYCTLITCGQVFVCCSTKTLSKIVIGQPRKAQIKTHRS